MELSVVTALLRTSEAQDLNLEKRLSVAPTAGVFHPLVFDVTADDPLRVEAGDEIGIIVLSGEKHPVSSRFTGLLVGMLVLPGERVRIHQPLAWLRSGPLDGPPCHGERCSSWAT